MVSKEYCKCIDVFANPLRMKLLKHLKKESLSVSQLTEKTGAERSRVSHALKELRECNLVTSNKKGRQSIYRINEYTPITSKGDLLTLIKNHVRYNCKECKYEK